MTTEAAADRRSETSARTLPWLLLVVVVVTRLGAVYLADHPDSYGTPNTRIVGDVEIYRRWSDAITKGGLTPYSDVAIEYPPAVLPFALMPSIGPDDAYRTLFILSMLVLDLAGLLGVAAVGRRRGSTIGMWLWAIGVPAIGPILYLRLDLIPAIATIWAFERWSADSPGVSGGWLGLGVVAKVYPVLILPIAAIMARNKRALIAGAALVAAAIVLPFVGSLGSLLSNVIGYHSDRGLQIESLWGTSLLIAAHFGHGAAVEFSFGAFHVASGMSSTLEVLADLAALTALGAGILFAFKLRDDDDPLAAEVSFATLACIVAVGTVFSPQFMVWLLALAAIVASGRGSQLTVPSLALLPLCALTQLIYPFNYDELVFQGDGELVPQLMILTRNLGVLAVGIVAFTILARGARDRAPG
ncbi:MAG TPA: glycosyltransferase 87 family protein [Actinomycetota bacterium]|jgi:hypothetical protein